MSDGGEATREQIEAAITEGLRYAGLRDSQRNMVRTYLRDDPATWMSCCGSYCDPCVLTIGHAVRKAREVLGWPAFPSTADIG